MLKAFTALLLLCPCYCLAGSEEDSLIRIIRQPNVADTTKALSLAQLSLTVVYSKPDSAMLVVQQALALSQKINYPTGICKSYNRLGIVYDVLGKYDSAIYVYNLAFSIAEKNKVPTVAASALNNLGLIYWNRGLKDRANNYLVQALRRFELLGNKQMKANTLNNIGLVLEEMGQAAKSVGYFKQAIVLYKEVSDRYGHASALSNLAISYERLNQNQEALVLYREAIPLQMAEQDEYGLSITYLNTGDVFNDLHQADSAFFYLKKAYRLKRQLAETKGLAMVSNILGGMYLDTNSDSAWAYLQIALQAGEAENIYSTLVSTYGRLSDWYSNQGKPAEALAFYKKYKAAADSVSGQDAARTAQEFLLRYETEKKEQQLALQQVQLSRKNLLLYGGSFLFLLAGGLGISSYRRMQLKKDVRLKQEVARQQQLAAQAVLEAEEHERSRIASDLHDGVGQLMSAAKMNLSAIETDLLFSGPEQRLAYQRAMSIVDESCREVRSVSHQMMPNALMKEGLGNAVKTFVSHLHQRSLVIHVSAQGLDDRIDSHTETVLYRVIQECVNNVVKHAAATRLDISLIKDGDGIAVTIEDNGQGFDLPAAMEKEAGIGLKNIQSRIQFLGGTVEWQTALGEGTLTAVHVP